MNPGKYKNVMPMLYLKVLVKT